MKALVDADIVRYRVGFASNDVPEEIALVRAETMIDDCLLDVGATEYQLYLSDSLSNNFRLKFDKHYKENRVGQPKPLHHEALGLFLKQEWGALVASGQEADDALGIEHTANSDSVICSIDKDLLQVPGKHYNFVKKEWSEIDDQEGSYNFFRQFLVGDRTDNIFGVGGIGPVKAKSLLYNKTSQDMFDIVRALYEDDERLLCNGRLLWVRRKENEDWLEQYLSYAGETKSLFTQVKEPEVVQSLEPTTVNMMG